MQPDDCDCESCLTAKAKFEIVAALCAIPVLALILTLCYRLL